jgi:hypothetical protein
MKLIFYPEMNLIEVENNQLLRYVLTKLLKHWTLLP